MQSDWVSTRLRQTSCMFTSFKTFLSDTKEAFLNHYDYETKTMTRYVTVGIVFF